MTTYLIFIRLNEWWYFLEKGKLKARRFLSHSFPEWISGSKLRELVTRIIEGWLRGYGGLLAMSFRGLMCSHHHPFQNSNSPALHYLLIYYYLKFVFRHTFGFAPHSRFGDRLLDYYLSFFHIILLIGKIGS